MRSIGLNSLRNLHTLLVGFTLTVAALIPQLALAWGSQGHQIIAALAQSQLTPAARMEVDRLLALEAGATLESISTWADEHRNPATAAWHYINFPWDSCTYDASRACLTNVT
jgi:hypothetical protein